MYEAWGSLFFSFFILFLVGIISWLVVKKRGNLLAGKNGVINIVQITPISPRNRLLLVKVSDEFLLLGVTDSNINLIHQLEKPPGMAGDDKIENIMD